MRLLGRRTARPLICLAVCRNTRSAVCYVGPLKRRDVGRSEMFLRVVVLGGETRSMCVVSSFFSLFSVVRPSALGSIAVATGVVGS